MARTVDDIESYLQRLGRNFDRHDHTFLVDTGAAGPPIAMHVAAPVIVMRVDIGQVPADPKHQLALFRQLLEYNASDLVHASYGLDGEQILLSAGQQLENVDINELDAALSDLDLALSSHVPRLRELATK
jgi:hypothetical protein